MTAATTMPPAPPPAVAETALYDRQIRLWGVAAQQRTRAARVAVVGQLARGLAAEVVKFLVLAGVGHVELRDWPSPSSKRSSTNSTTNFFLAAATGDQDDDVAGTVAGTVAAAAQQLNAHVRVVVAPPAADSNADAVVRGADLVVLCDVPAHDMVRVARAARTHHVPLLAGNVYGLRACVFADLLDHGYTHTRVIDSERRDAEPTEVRTTCKLRYAPLDAALDAAVPRPRRGVRATRDVVAVLALTKYLRDHKGTFPSTDRAWTDLHAYFKREAQLHGVVHDVSPQALRDDVLRAPHLEAGPICALAGGVLAQEALKAVQKTHRPITNLAVFSLPAALGAVVDLAMDPNAVELPEEDSAAAGAG